MLFCTVHLIRSINDLEAATRKHGNSWVSFNFDGWKAALSKLGKEVYLIHLAV